MSASATNSNHVQSTEIDSIDELDLDLEFELEDDLQIGQSEDTEIWSALTLGSLKKQLQGRENDPRFVDVVALVDSLSSRFAKSDPIDLADYFEAVQAIDVAKKLPSPNPSV